VLERVFYEVDEMQLHGKVCEGDLEVAASHETGLDRDSMANY
jgi:hypothetical protein